MEGDQKVVTLPTRTQTNPIVSFAKKVGLRTLAWLGVYLLGYFDFSIAWMITPLLLSVLRDQWKKDKRNKLIAAREAAITNEKVMLETRMSAEELPSWVFFPDKERAEWFNSILKQLWPYVNEYVRDTLFNTVEPAVQAALKPYKLSGFRFERERVFLGQVPPRITGIKVYDANTSRREIILDVDLVFASDMEIVFKVKGISARVSDFGLRGMARVVFKPLISQIPLIGGVQVYFLKVPEIDYALGGVGGVLEMPGLNKIVEKIILEQVRNFIVLPNKFSMPLVTTIPNKVLKCPDSAGVLRVKLIKAKSLKDADGLGSGKSDPYCILTVGAHTSRAPTILDNLNPEWNMTFDFPIEIVQGQELLLEFYDEDSRKGDQFLGRAKVQSSLVADRGHIESYWVDLQGTEGKEEEPLGQAQVSLSWLPVTLDSALVKSAAKEAGTRQGLDTDSQQAACLVHLYIDSCTGLVNSRDPAYKPSPKVEVINGSRTVQRSWPQYFTTDPVIEQGFVALIDHPYTDEIRLDVIDTASKDDEIIGTSTIRIWSLIEQPDMEYPLQPFLLKGNSPDAKILISASLRGLLKADKNASPRKSTASSPVSTPIASPGLSSSALAGTVEGGRCRLTIHEAKELEKKDISGKADPYVVVTYEGNAQKTSHMKKDLEPVWNQEMWIDVADNGDIQILVEVFDRDRVGKDELMGRTTIDVRRLSKQGRIEKVWDRLLSCKSGKICWSAEFFPHEGDPSLSPVDSEMCDDTEARKEDIGQTCDPDLGNMVQVPDRTNFVDDDPKTEDVLSKLTEDPSLPSVSVSPKPQLESPEPELVSLAESEEPAVEAFTTADQVSRLDTTAEADNNEAKLGYMLGRVVPGFLKVTVHRAEDLTNKDKIGKSDPYVVIKYAGQKNKSKHVESCLDPEFHFSTGYVTEEGGDHDINIEIKDHDTVGKNESLGSVALDLRTILAEGGGCQESWLPLQGVPKGRVQVTVDFSGEGSGEEELGLSSDPMSASQLRRRVVQEPKLRLNILYDENREELKVFLHEAANLPIKDLQDPPDPQVKLCLMPGKKKKKKSQVVKDDENPKFDEEFDFDIDFEDLPKFSLEMSVIDKKGLFGRSPVLGKLTISLDNPGLRKGLADWFPLEDADDDSE